MSAPSEYSDVTRYAGPPRAPRRGDDPPRLVERAYSLALAQIVLAFVALVWQLSDVDALASELYQADLLSYSSSDGGAIALLVVLFALGNGLWLWLASRMRRGQNWARVLMCVVNALVVLNLFVVLSSGEAASIGFAAASAALAVVACVPLCANGVDRWFRRG